VASVIRDPGGRKRIQFVAGDGSRRTIRLGKIERRHAEAIRIKVELLQSAAAMNQPLDRPTSEWVASIDDALHAKLASVGLVKPRLGRSLSAWLSTFMESRADLKPESRRKLEQTRSKLLEHFGEHRQLHEITSEAAVAWRDSLKAKGLSVAAVKTHVGNAKTIFAEAVRREILPQSPFVELKGGVTPTRNTRYVTPDETERVLAACPDAEWRLLIGLARLAGLRTPSETNLLTWADVDWDRARLRVRSPKTERHAGHEARWVPICPRLMELLQERFEAASEGDERLVTIKGAGARRRKIVAIVERAGVQMWEATWQTLRRSCEIEWAQTYPQFAVSRWIGHSITVSGRHYANAVPDELFDRVAGLKAAQNAAQYPAESVRSGAQRDGEAVAAETRKPAQSGAMRESAKTRMTSGKWSRGESNPRARAVSPENPREFRGACSARRSAQRTGPEGRPPARQGARQRGGPRRRWFARVPERRPRRDRAAGPRPRPRRGGVGDGARGGPAGDRGDGGGGGVSGRRLDRAGAPACADLQIT